MSLGRCALALAFAFLAGIGVSQDAVPFHVDVSLVPVTVSITDSDGRPARDIKASELKLLDNGKPREIQYFSQEHDLPLTVGVIIDLSGSQDRYRLQHYRNVKQFLKQVLRPGDRAFLVSVVCDVRLVTDLTPSVGEILAGVDALEANPMAGIQFGDPCRKPASAIWNSVYSAARLKLKSVEGRKALVLLSDGLDTGSQHSLSSTIEAAQAADGLVYTLGSKAVPAIAWMTPMLKARSSHGIANLSRLAEETGGRAHRVDGDSSKIFEEIEADLRTLYLLGFQVPEQDRDGKFHELKVTSTRPGMRVRARKGYYSAHYNERIDPSLVPR